MIHSFRLQLSKPGSLPVGSVMMVPPLGMSLFHIFFHSSFILKSAILDLENGLLDFSLEDVGAFSMVTFKGVGSSVSSICVWIFWFAACLLRSGGAMALMVGSHCMGVDFKHPDTIRIVSLNFTPTCFT